MSRLAAIVAGLDLSPDDSVLEIGCGHGVGAGLICTRLERGAYVGVDRSPKMIAAATARNADFVVSGRARFLCAALETLDLGKARFDTVLAVRVGLFAVSPERARALAGAWLRPGGRLVAVYDRPGEANGDRP